MKFRRIIFWAHLGAGLFCGLIIGIMSVTGILIAFEHEILEWVDREQALVTPRNASAQPLDIEDILCRAKLVIPGSRLAYIRIHNSRDKAHLLRTDNNQTLYVDPFSGDVSLSRSGHLQAILHKVEAWHRFLGMHGEKQLTGKFINGISNLIFLFLCISGLYLWFPYKLSWRIVRQRLLFSQKAKGKARDLNWHNVFGFWCAPVLIVLSGTAVIFSFSWGHALLFTAFGEEAPQYRDFRMMLVPEAALPVHPPDAPLLSLDDLLAEAKQAYPQWQAIGIRNPSQSIAAAKPQAIEVYVPALFSTMGYIPIAMDPHTGKVIQSTRWQDRSPGLRARVWARFLHTGEAFGLPGKIIATLSTAAALLLLYTGLALSYRRLKRSLAARGIRISREK